MHIAFLFNPSIILGPKPQNHTTMTITKALVAICSLMFLMIGADKFLNFLEPPCSLMDTIPPMVWSAFGVLQLLAGFLICFPSTRKPTAIFFAIFMLVFTIYHLTQQTYDIGGSAFMAILLGLIAWNPPFLRTKSSE